LDITHDGILPYFYSTLTSFVTDCSAGPKIKQEEFGL
jgi:hypothetical protein